VGELTVSRRYDLIPLLRSHPGGFKGSWPYRTRPCLLRKAGAKVQQKSEKQEVKSEKFVVFNYFLSEATQYVRENA